MRERLELVEGILKNKSGEIQGMVSEQVKNGLAMSNTLYGDNSF